jgi:hypothetical protein
LVIVFLHGREYDVTAYPGQTFDSEAACVRYVEEYHRKYPAEGNPAVTVACAPASVLRTFAPASAPAAKRGPKT